MSGSAQSGFSGYDGQVDHGFILLGVGQQDWRKPSCLMNKDTYTSIRSIDPAYAFVHIAASDS